MRTAPKWYNNPVLEVMLLDNDQPTSYGEAMMGPDSKKWLKAMKSEKGSMYETKYGLWKYYLKGVRPFGINGSLRGRRTRTVMSPSIKLDLWQRVYHKFKELTTMRLAHP